MLHKYFPILGSKVSLRIFTEHDINDRYLSWLNDLEVVKYSNQRFITHTIESSMVYLKAFNNSSNIFLSISTIDKNIPIGTLTIYHSPQHQTADIGILVGEKSLWGNGYGQDAWDTIIKLLSRLPSIRKITAGAVSANIGMINLMIRSGMSFEAAKIEQELVNGVPVDLHYYAKFNR
jgi:ribosomal-protein-alanine N-acetyltransferase